MSELTALAASPRDRAGKGAARATRREGFVPAVIYGGKDEPTLIKLDPRQLLAALRKPGFWGTQFSIDIEGKANRVLPRDVQFHPVTSDPLHVDFLRVTDRTRVTVSVPVEFVNEEASPGLERGGVLNIVRHEIDVVAAAGNIPEKITVDLTGLDINDGAHISMVKLPSGVTPAITDRDFTIATIAAPTVVSEEATEAEEAGAEAEDETDDEE